jgi:hypothetical protein
MTHMGSLPSTATVRRRKASTSRPTIRTAALLPTRLRDISSKVTMIRTSSTERISSRAITTHNKATVRLVAQLRAIAVLAQL